MTVHPHAKRIEIRVPETEKEFAAFVKRHLGLDFDEIPTSLWSDWQKFNGRSAKEKSRLLVIEDLEIKAFEKGDRRFSAGKLIHTMRERGRKSLDCLAGIGMAVAIDTGVIAMPHPCRGIRMLSSTRGRRAMDFSRVRPGQWRLEERPLNNTADYHFACSKA